MVGGVGHPDDGERHVVDLDGRADDVGIGAEVGAPQTVAEDHHRMAARRDLVGRLQDAAALGADAEHVEVVPGDQLARHRAGAAASPERDGGQRRAEEIGERPVVLAQLQVVGIRQPEGAAGAGLARGRRAGWPSRATPASGVSAMLLSMVKTAAFTPMPSASTPTTVSRERLVLQERPDRVADVARQVAQRPRATRASTPGAPPRW